MDTRQVLTANLDWNPRKKNRIGYLLMGRDYNPLGHLNAFISKSNNVVSGL